MDPQFDCPRSGALLLFRRIGMPVKVGGRDFALDLYSRWWPCFSMTALADAEAEIEPVPTDGTGRKPEPELDRLSNILNSFNEQFATLFTDTDRVARRIRDDIAPKVAADAAYQNARENTPHTARMAHNQALGKVMQLLLKDDTKVYKEFMENDSFKRFVGDMVYALTSDV